MVVTISTKYSFYFRQRLELLKSFKPYNKLRPRELDLLAGLQHSYFKCISSLKVIPEQEELDSMVFNSVTFDRLRGDLSMSEYVLNNNKMGLRNMEFLSKTGLKKEYVVDPDKESTLTFNFIIS